LSAMEICLLLGWKSVFLPRPFRQLCFMSRKVGFMFCKPHGFMGPTLWKYFLPFSGLIIFVLLHILKLVPKDNYLLILL
jgi:hypothetical protein